MTFILATNNPKKLRELEAILSGRQICTLKQAGIDIEIAETGQTFEENALIKARAACAASGLPAIADDSGLEVDALGGRPGVLSARYCEGTDEDRVRFLLENMKDIPGESRTARFVSAVACVFSDGREIVVRGECNGVILRECRGDGGFGYDPVFFVPEENGTFAEITAETKNRISHRGKALQKLKKELEGAAEAGKETKAL